MRLSNICLSISAFLGLSLGFTTAYAFPSDTNNNNLCLELRKSYNTTNREAACKIARQAIAQYGASACNDGAKSFFKSRCNKYAVDFDANEIPKDSKYSSLANNNGTVINDMSDVDASPMRRPFNVNRTASASATNTNSGASASSSTRRPFSINKTTSATPAAANTATVSNNTTRRPFVATKQVSSAATTEQVNPVTPLVVSQTTSTVPDQSAYTPEAKTIEVVQPSGQQITTITVSSETPVVATISLVNPDQSKTNETGTMMPSTAVINVDADGKAHVQSSSNLSVDAIVATKGTTSANNNVVASAPVADNNVVASAPVADNNVVVSAPVADNNVAADNTAFANAPVADNNVATNNAIIDISAIAANNTLANNSVAALDAPVAANSVDNVDANTNSYCDAFYEADLNDDVVAGCKAAMKAAMTYGPTACQGTAKEYFELICESQISIN